MGRRVGGPEFTVVVLGSAIIGALTLYPAGEVRVGSEPLVVHLGDLFGFRAVVLTICGLLVVVAALEIFVAKRAARIAAIGYGLVLLVTTMWVVTVEGVGLLIPRRFMPVTIRRFALGLGATWAPWLVMVVAVVVILACVGVLETLVRRVLRDDDESDAVLALRLGLLVLVAVGVALVGFGRTSSLAVVGWQDRTIDVEPWAIPYVGPGSLIALILLTVAGLAVAGRWHVTPFALLGSGVSWLAATAFGLLYATSSLLVKTGVLEWAARRVGQDDFANNTALTAGSGAVWMFVGAVGAGIGFASLLAATGDLHE